MDFDYVSITIDGSGSLDYIFDHRVFDKLWLVNKYKVITSSSARRKDFDSLQDKEKREYLLKGFDNIPIEGTLRVGIGPDGLLDPEKIPWRPRREDAIKFLNSLIKENKVSVSDAAKSLWLLNSKYLVTTENKIVDLLDICKNQFNREGPKIISPLEFEQLIDELLANDEYCKYHSPETMISFGMIKWP